MIKFLKKKKKVDWKKSRINACAVVGWKANTNQIQHLYFN